MKRIKIENLKPLNSDVQDLNEKQAQKINGGGEQKLLPTCVNSSGDWPPPPPSLP